jgi:CheY-like chemotaxis protein
MKTEKILIVEDDPVNQKVIELLLNHFGYKVDIAATSQQALKLFQEQSYHGVFMDLGLPDGSGIELTEIFRRHEKEHMASHTAIIALTASSQTLKSACLLAGMDDFLVKPILLADLEVKLRQWLDYQA